MACGGEGHTVRTRGDEDPRDGGGGSRKGSFLQRVVAVGPICGTDTEHDVCS
jgi:hypothetical protein